MTTIQSTHSKQTWTLPSAPNFPSPISNPLVPTPDTPLYEQPHCEGLLIHDSWWLHPEYRFNYASFKPAQMTAEELTQIAFDIRSKWNSFGAILRRFFDLRTNMRTPYKMGIYWRYNPLFRKEMFKKQGMVFGRR